MTSNQRGVKALLTQEHGILGTADSGAGMEGESFKIHASARDRSVGCVLSCNSNEP